LAEIWIRANPQREERSSYDSLGNEANLDSQLIEYQMWVAIRPYNLFN